MEGREVQEQERNHFLKCASHCEAITQTQLETAAVSPRHQMTKVAYENASRPRKTFPVTNWASPAQGRCGGRKESGKTQLAAFLSFHPSTEGKPGRLLNMTQCPLSALESFRSNSFIPFSIQRSVDTFICWLHFFLIVCPASECPPVCPLLSQTTTPRRMYSREQASPAL